MKPIILTYILGPLENNTYLIADPVSKEAALIDPSFEAETAVKDARSRGYLIRWVLLTHGHFDHIAGVTAAAPPAVVGLHPDELQLYQHQGNADQFGLSVDAGPQPGLLLAHGQVLKVGEVELEVRHTPGHTPGHVVFVCPAGGFACCGDVIFAGSVGRTDFEGGSHTQLMTSIHEQIMTLPHDMLLYSGHGPQTSVGEEAVSNPFL